MNLPRGEAKYGPGLGSRSRPSVPLSGSAFLGMLEVPCFALLDSGEATTTVIGNYGNEEAIESGIGGDQTAASRSLGGVTIRCDYPSGASAFVTSEVKVSLAVNDWRTRQRYLEGALVMLSGEYRDYGSTNVVNELEWKNTVVDVAGIPGRFIETRLQNSRFDDARLLVGQLDATIISIVASDHSITLALREVTATDLDRWLKR
jgi:hypothetical protein